MARPRLELEDMEFNGWDQLKVLAVWATAEYCADQLGMSSDSLDRRLKEKYGHGFAEYKKKVQEPMRINLLKKQYDVAMSGNTAMLIWLGKQHLGQKDKHENDVKIGESSGVHISIIKDESDL
jgi:hypothetical protein